MSRVSACRMAEHVPCDAVLVGIGAARERCTRPRGRALLAPMASSSMPVARTSDPAIHAIGDCTHRPLPLLSAGQVGSRACRTRWNRRSRQPPNCAVVRRRRRRFPGSGPISTTCVCRSPACCSMWRKAWCAGIRAAGAFAIFHLAADGTVQAVEAVNAPTEFMAGRVMIARQEACCGRQAARRVMLDAGTRSIDRHGSPGGALPSVENCVSLAWTACPRRSVSQSDGPAAVYSAQAMTCPSSHMPRHTHSCPYSTSR